MPASGIRLHLAVLLGYVCVVAAFTWPLPAHLGSAFLGGVGGDLGVYVWNLWLFRHEILAHGSFPFLTLEILPLTPPLPLTLHNYTPVANLLAAFLIPLAGLVTTFNLLTMLSAVGAAYAMFLLARRLTGDAAASWISGLLFGFSPFLNARAMEHFSLVQAAPLPVFVLLFDRLRTAPSTAAGIATGTCVAWAFLSDPYYAVYCALIAGVMLAATMTAPRLVRVTAPAGLKKGVTVALVCLAALIVGISLSGGGQVEVLGVRVSLTGLHNPVMAFTVLLLARLALSAQPRLSWTFAAPPFRVLLAAAVTCALLLAPVLVAMFVQFRESQWVTPPVLWRSSAPGVDALAFFVPNPLHPWFGHLSRGELSRLPGGFVENVAAIPWTALALVVGAAVAAKRRPPTFWLAFTALFALLALGPFVKVAGILTYVPTPWALLRYVPILGAARMPSRFSILVMLGIAALAAFAVRDLSARARRPRILVAAISLVLLAELLPAPRTLHSAEVPSVYRIIRDDPRPVRVLDLPFGLRDGLTSHGNTTAAWQYYQTLHEKPILGGYLSRLPSGDVDYYWSRPLLKTLMTLSAGHPVGPASRDRAIASARELRGEYRIGYVVVNTRTAPAELVEFVREAFALRLVGTDGPFDLYRSLLLDQ